MDNQPITTKPKEDTHTHKTPKQSKENKVQDSDLAGKES